MLFSLLFLANPALAEPLTLEVTEAEPAYHSSSGQVLVSFRLSEASRKAFAEFSAAHVGDKIDMRIDGKSISQVVIREPIIGGTGQINASTPDEARQLAARLASKTARFEVELVP